MVVRATSAGVAGLKWRKSTYSGDPSIGTCVEVAAMDGSRAVRDSKNPTGPMLTFSVSELRTLITSIKSGEL
ncbi:DUF397 domain-containing protein [Spirillospora sp. NPDC029432]|uniref:DUF397 domain-containing protein n=1 Tax=Spirillospora sp. NPDC029432 TaxID=3154599 RepID=UPI003455F57F